jgi:hypothetical protein
MGCAVVMVLTQKSGARRNNNMRNKRRNWGGESFVDIRGERGAGQTKTWFRRTERRAREAYNR